MYLDKFIHIHVYIGLQHWEEVVSIIYSQIQNISLMKDLELQRVWSEIKASGSINFRYVRTRTCTHP
jgi:hypothetical protein